MPVEHTQSSPVPTQAPVKEPGSSAQTSEPPLYPGTSSPCQPAPGDAGDAKDAKQAAIEPDLVRPNVDTTLPKAPSDENLVTPQQALAPMETKCVAANPESSTGFQSRVQEPVRVELPHRPAAAQEPLNDGEIVSAAIDGKEQSAPCLKPSESGVDTKVAAAPRSKASQGSPSGNEASGHARRRSTKILMSSPTVPATPFASATSGAVSEAPAAWPVPPHSEEAKMRSPTTSLGSLKSASSLKEKDQERKESKGGYIEAYQDGKHTYTYEPIASTSPKSSPHRRTKSLNHACTKSLTQPHIKSHARNDHGPTAEALPLAAADMTAGPTLATLKFVSPPDELLKKPVHDRSEAQIPSQDLATQPEPALRTQGINYGPEQAENRKMAVEPRGLGTKAFAPVTDPPAESTQPARKSEEVKREATALVMERPVKPLGSVTRSEAEITAAPAPTSADVAVNSVEPTAQVTRSESPFDLTDPSAASGTNGAERQTSKVTPGPGKSSSSPPSSVNTFATAPDVHARSSLKPVFTADSASSHSPPDLTQYTTPLHASPDLVAQDGRLPVTSGPSVGAEGTVVAQDLPAIPVRSAPAAVQPNPSQEAESVDSSSLPVLPESLPSSASDEDKPVKTEAGGLASRVSLKSEPSRALAAPDGYNTREAPTFLGSKIPRARVAGAQHGERMSMPPAAPTPALEPVQPSRNVQRMSLPPLGPGGEHEVKHAHAHDDEREHGHDTSPSLLRRGSSKFFSLHTGQADDVVDAEGTPAPRKRRHSLSKRASSLFHKKDKASSDPPPMPHGAAATVHAAQFPSTTKTHSINTTGRTGHEPQAPQYLSSGSGSGSAAKVGPGSHGGSHRPHDSDDSSGRLSTRPPTHGASEKSSRIDVQTQAQTRTAAQPQPTSEIAAAGLGTGDGEKHGLGARLRRLSFGRSLKKRHSHPPLGTGDADAPLLPDTRPAGNDTK